MKKTAKTLMIGLVALALATVQAEDDKAAKADQRWKGTK